MRDFYWIVVVFALCLGQSPVRADTALSTDSDVPAEIQKVAESLADAHKPLVLGDVKREDLVAAFVRGLCTTIGVVTALYAMPSEQSIPLSSTLFVSLVAGLVTAGFQLKYEPVSLWQTHWIDWRLENGRPQMKAKYAHGPMMLMFKEFNLQLVYYAFVNLAFYFAGYGESHLSRIFSEAGWGVLVDGTGYIFVSTQVVRAVAKLEEKLRAGTLTEKEFARRQRKTWALGKAAATGLSAIATGLILAKSKVIGADSGFWGDAASMAVYSMSILFGGAYVVQTLRHPQGLVKELRSLLRACKIGRNRTHNVLDGVGNR